MPRLAGRDQGRALLKSLATSLVLNESVITTKPRAKQLVPYFERLVTYAKKANLAGLRLLRASLTTETAAKKVQTDLAKRFAKRSGGYARLSAHGWRAGDDAELVQVELTEKAPIQPATKPTDIAKPSASPKPKAKAITKKAKVAA